MWGKKAKAEEPFDDASYVPEPTDHFEAATNNLQKAGAGGAILVGGYYIFKMLMAGGLFN
jgi:hypothetical protein